MTIIVGLVLLFISSYVFRSTMRIIELEASKFQVTLSIILGFLVMLTGIATLMGA